MEKTKLIERKIEGWDAIIFLEETPDERRFSISFAGKGGAIVSSHSYDRAERKFIRAMKLSEAIMKFRRYSKLNLN
jgi:hypothetical protein